MREIKLKNFNISNNLPLTLIAGPCVLENKDHAFLMIEKLLDITKRLKINFIFKTSFDKANRTSLLSERGVGFKEAIKIFEEIKNIYQCPILTDVHNEFQCNEISNVVDILQIPAFLCRQTDLLVSAAKTNKIINIKKGQFLSPYEINEVINKLVKSNNTNILLTERGYCFGYNNLVTDFRSLEIMKKTNYPVIFDATHSVQEPGLKGSSSGGKREFIAPLSKAAVSIGIAGIFIETHNNPEIAPSDGSNMLPVNELENLLKKLIQFDEIAKS
tara:strand:- start:383 stop:1201 length:819 start_codon:yes stop_codon:yes gene_type:complete